VFIYEVKNHKTFSEMACYRGYTHRAQRYLLTVHKDIEVLQDKYHMYRALLEENNELIAG
jgi:hypothetical protein